jgi:hypothetical protein
LFAYGGGGYGSLQEFMILDKYYDVIKPDLIIWQYTTNDFINNSPELEMLSYGNNNGIVRPYWVDGTVRYIFPARHAVNVTEFALRYCRICYIVLNRSTKLAAMMTPDSVEYQTGPGKAANRLFLESARVTDEIMGMVRKRAGSVPIAAFVLGNGVYGPEYAEAFAEISRNHNIVLLDVETEVLAAERNGTVIRAADNAHWNEAGHRIAGQALTHALLRANLIGERHPAVTHPE